MVTENNVDRKKLNLSVAVKVGPLMANLKHKHGAPFTNENSLLDAHPHPCALKFEFTAATSRDVSFFVGQEALDALNRRVQEFFTPVFEVPHEQVIQDLFYKLDDELDAICVESGVKRSFNLTGLEMAISSKPDEFDHIDGEGIFTARLAP